jgi:hypothetical protein
MVPRIGNESKLYPFQDLNRRLFPGRRDRNATRRNTRGLAVTAQNGVAGKLFLSSVFPLFR